MSKEGRENGSPLSVFQFSYDEHGWDVDSEDSAREAVLKAAAEQPWVLVEGVDQAKAKGYCDDGIETLDDLLRLIRATIVEDWNMPVEAVKIPLDRLSERMRQDGWVFVGGSFTEFEGHHNDSEIHVVLQKKA